MNENTLNSLKEALLVRQGELTVEIERLSEELMDLSIEQEGEHGGVGNHLADDGSSLGEQERISTVGEDFKDQLQQISAALQRMEAGTYGKCQRCGKAVKVDRLRALPFAAFCIECQSHLERQASLFGAASNQR